MYTQSSPIQIRVAAELERRRRVDTVETKFSFVDFIAKVNPKYKWYPHVKKLSDVLERVERGEVKRLMIFMPPRHGKSELVSRLFSAYYLYKHPDKWVGINSYAAELAYTFSRNSRDNYRTSGGILKGDAAAVKQWETGKGGGLWAAGVGGPITGKGFDLGIIDDPIKNADEAASEVIREKHKDWYNSTFYTREEPSGAIIIIQTRWHEDDLSGWLLSQEDEEEPEHWHIVHFEAIKEDDEPDYPATCTIEHDNRKTGEALAPMRYPLEKLNKISKRIGSYFFGALYQQRPKPREGNMFKRQWFDVVDKIPENIKHVRYWDKAGTKDGGAYTAGVLMAVDEDNIFYVEDIVRGQWAAGQREAIIKSTAQMDGEDVIIWVEQEPGSGGKESAESTIKNLAGFSVYADKVTGDKVTRAEPFQAQCEGKNVKLKKADWNYGYLERLTGFPNAKYKDDIDASSGAFNKLTQNKWVDIDFMHL